MSDDFKPLAFLTRMRGPATRDDAAADATGACAGEPEHVVDDGGTMRLRIEPKKPSPEQRKASIEAFNAVLEARPGLDRDDCGSLPRDVEREAAPSLSSPAAASPKLMPEASVYIVGATPQTPSLGLVPVVSDKRVAERVASLSEEGLDHARTARSPHTLRAYDAARRSFDAFRRHIGVVDENETVTPEQVGLWITWMGRQDIRGSTIRSRVDGLLSLLRMRQIPVDRSHPAIRDILAGLLRKRLQPAQGKAALRPEEVVAMADACERGTKRGLRDRAILLFGFVSSLRRSEIVKLDCGRLSDSEGWIEIEPEGLIVHVLGKTGWREVVITRGSTGACPVKAVEDWMEFGRVGHGPLFRRILLGDVVTADRLTDKSVYNLVVEKAVQIGLDAGMFGAHSLRAGFATFARGAEADIQQQLGHANPAMTRRYRRRRDRFAADPTKAIGF